MEIFFIFHELFRKCVQQEPVYISFSNTIAIPFFSIFRQIIFTHDFAWSRSFRRSIGLNFRRSLGDYYVSLNRYLLNIFVTAFVPISGYVNSLIHNLSPYSSKSWLIYNPLEKTIATPDFTCNTPVHARFSTSNADISLLKISIIGGQSPIKNAFQPEVVSDYLRRHSVPHVIVVLGTKPTISSSSSVLFLGHLSHSEMVSYISLSDVVIVPSFTESFSYPAFISYNLGKKVIISKFSQLAQYDLPSVFPFSPQSLPSFLDALQTSLIAPKPAKVQPIHYPVESQAEQLYRLASNTIPLLIYHNGDQLYLKCVLKRLVDFGYRVILICCSRTSIEVSGVQVLNLYGYVNEDWNRFNQSYSHMSFNGYNNELICFKLLV